MYNESLTFIKEGCKGNVLIDGRYAYDWGEDRIPYKKILQAIFTNRKIPHWNFHEDWSPTVVMGKDFFEADNDAYVWLGHSTFLFSIGNETWITDPIFFDLSILMKRTHTLPCSPEELPKIDHILLSHGHRDHLDIKSLKILAQKNKETKIYCPLGHATLLRDIGFIHIQEAAWYQQYNTSEHTQLVLCPARHWNRRFIRDYNITLWGSFYLVHGDIRLYFAGDTAYGQHFKEINALMGKPSHAFMPVGAYRPTSVMSWAHTSPQEAWQGYTDLEATVFIPMHYGTYKLSAESPREALDFLYQKKKNADVSIPDVGEVCKFQPSS